VHGFFNGIFIEGVTRVGYASIWYKKYEFEDDQCLVAKELAKLEDN
jgi:hypothetical protein